MKINVSVHARATGEERQAYTFETEYDITWRISNKQQELFYFFIQWFIAGAFKRYTNQYLLLSVRDAKEDKPPTNVFQQSKKIENFEIKITDPSWI